MARVSSPSVSQIAMASERPVLATLDAALEMAARTLMAEHPMLERDAGPAAGEPLPPCQALAASIIILAKTLHELIESYCAALERIYGDHPEDEDAPT